MDTLLGKLRQHMAELSVQGDDFTRQMWQMYSAFEDILERQNDCVMLDEEPRFTSSQRFHPPALGAEQMPLGGEEDYELWSTMASMSRDPRTASDVEDENYSESEVDNEETDLIKEGIRNEMERRKLILRLENAEMMLADQSRHHFNYSNTSAPPLFNSPMNGKSVRRHRHCQKRRRLPAPPSHRQLRESRLGAPPEVDVTSSNHHLHHHRHHTNRHHHLEFFDDKLTQSTPSVNTSVTNPDMGVTVEPNNDMKRCGTPTIPYGEIPYRRSSAPELLDNPLLETISTIEDLCESDDYAELPLNRCKTQLPLSAAASCEKDIGEKCRENSQAEVCKEERQQQHHNSDGDRDSVGYAGSNSVDSGYKSSCPTPELLDPCYYAQGAICNGISSSASSSRRNSKMSRENKSRNIPMGTRAIRHHAPPPSASITSQSPSAETGNSSSAGTGSGTSSPSRNSTPATETSGGGGSNNNRSPSDYNYYDVNLDHLMYLRQSLLSAIQRCNLGESGNGKSTAESDNDYLFDSTDIRQFMSEPQSRKSWSAVDLRSHSPPLTGSSLDTGNAGATLNDRWVLQREEEMRTLRHQLRSNSLVQVNVHESGLDEQRLTLAGDNAEYYDLESIKDFPCSYGMTAEPRTRASSLVKLRKVKDESPLVEKKATKASVTSTLEESSRTASGRASSKQPPQRHTSEPSVELKMRPEVTPSEVGIDRAKFSEVAVCMLKIIEDIQHQQLQQKPREVTSSPASYDSERLSGADYHLYEEISYDLAGLHCTAASLLRSANQRDGQPKQMPPPLPARPNSIFGLNDARGIFRAEQHIKPKGPSSRPKHLATAPLRQTRRGNLYSIFTEQSDRRHLSRSLEREWRRGAQPPHFDNMDDEYGFKVVIKQPATRETRT